MYAISGKILIKETGAGIQNLQVVLYDVDNIENIDPKLREIFTSSTKPGSKANFFWQTLPGNRLGSVLTDEKGGFRIEFNEEDFLEFEKIKRPDVILFVMAPEDSNTDIKNNNSNLPKSPADRILLFSYDPVMNAGKKESYIIRIPKAKLEEFQINVYNPVITSSAETIENIKEEIKKSYRFSKNIKDALLEETNEKIKRGLSIKRTADKTLQHFNLSKVPPETRSSNLYLNPKENVKDKLNKVVRETLERKIPQEDSSAKRKIVLKLNDEVLQKLGIAFNNGEIEGQVQIGKLFDHLGPSFTGGTLKNNFASIATCSREAKARKLFEEALAKCKEKEVVDEDSEKDDEQEVTGYSLGEQINRQMASTTPPEEVFVCDVERDGEIFTTIPKGPADNISYHDFHSVEIAFENIWTEAFDQSLAVSVASIVSEMVRYSHRISGTDELPEIHSINDMKQLYQDFLNLVEIIEQEEHASDPVGIIVIAPNIIETLLDISPEDWANMEDSDKSEIQRLAALYKHLKNTLEGRYGWIDGSHIPSFQRQRDDARNQAKEILAKSKKKTNEKRVNGLKETRLRKVSQPKSRLMALMADLDSALSEPHKFDIFAPNSMNYGLMFTYRQTWIPKNYQVGELVSTLPLAPKEMRKYTTKKSIKKTRAQKEIEDNQSTRSSESASTSRADAEIVKQAKNNTSFEMTTNATLSVGVVEGEFGTRLGIQAEKSSSDTKKNFREAVLKAAEEYKSQVRLEVETTASEEFETTTTGEITNPNEEITVTYLFYELQRQYQISEKLHQLTPVILVANDVPFPEEINEAWLISHDWVLQRVILDKSFLPALQYVTASIAGDELAMEILRDNVERQVKMVDALIFQVEKKTELANNAFNELKLLLNTHGTSVENLERMKEISLAIVLGPISLAGSGGDDNSAEKREEIAKLSIERADKNAQEVNAKLATEVTALKEAINKYTAALQEHFDRQTAIARLRIHIKENILYYMQAIWDYEPPDQRYFRLYNLEVPWINIDLPTRTARISRVSGTGSSIFREASNVSTYHAEVPLIFEQINTIPKKLHEIADLDNLLGFKGNYMIFPMKLNSYIHMYMMQDYIDAITGGLRDPDERGNYTTDDILDHLCCLQKKNPEVFEENKEALLNEFINLQDDSRKESDLVIVPTGSLYIEALPGKHPILEDFKLKHRALDVKKVLAEVRHAELENIRLATRLTLGEREDPDIDKKIVIEGTDASNLNIEAE